MNQAIVYLDDSHPSINDILILRPGKNLITGEREFRDEFAEITSLESDLLNVASAIFACDLAFKRGDRENISREIEVTIPVVNLASFRAQRDRIRYALFNLSHDTWNINFVSTTGIPEPNQNWTNTNSSLLLFSGGLDSFAGAINLGEKYGKIELVSHVTANPIVRGTQERLFSYLISKYNKKYSRLFFRVTGRTSRPYSFPTDTEREGSQRTRSFML